MDKPLILAIETSCDETAAAVLRGRTILSNEIYSQLDLHKAYGGVVPSIAKLAHQQKLPKIIETALKSAKVEITDIDLIAVTAGPGLAIALEVGVAQAIQLALAHGIPLLPINHMEGHLLSGLAGAVEADFPALGLLVSGKHSEFVLVSEIGKYQRLGFTLDDACGEAFDKCAYMLGLPYPGGPEVSRLADTGSETLDLKVEREHQSLYIRGYKKGEKQASYQLPVPMAFSGDLNVSYSGIKTAMRQLVEKTKAGGELGKQQLAELCLMFQTAAFKQLELKLNHALDQYPGIKQIWMGGGVVANAYFQKQVAEIAKRRGVSLLVPEGKGLLTDNAAMIGLAAAINWERFGFNAEKLEELGALIDPESITGLDRDPNWELGESSLAVHA